MEALIYFAVWAALIFLMLRFGCGAHVMGHGQYGARRRDGRSGTAEFRWVPPEVDIDPVCRKTIKTDQAKPSVHGGTVYYFCSRECRERFEAAPDLYVGPNAGRQSKQMDHVHG